MMVASPIASFTGLYSQLQRALGASERVFELLDTPPEMQDDPDALELPPIRGEVRFEGVSFDYADAKEAREVLREIELSASPGQVDRTGRPERRGQDDAGPPDSAVLRRDGGADHRRRLRYPACEDPQLARADRHRAAGDRAVQRQRAGEHPVRQAGRDSRPKMEAAARAANAHDFICDLPQRLRDAGRRARA